MSNRSQFLNVVGATSLLGAAPNIIVPRRLPLFGQTSTGILPGTNLTVEMGLRRAGLRGARDYTGTYVLPEYAHVDMFPRPQLQTGPCAKVGHLSNIFGPTPMATCPGSGGGNGPPATIANLPVIWSETIHAIPPTFTPPPEVAITVSSGGGTVKGGGGHGLTWNDISPGSTYSLDAAAIQVFNLAVQKCGSQVTRAGTSTLAAAASFIRASPKNYASDLVQLAAWLLAGDSVIAVGALLITSLTFAQWVVMAAAGVVAVYALGNVYAMFVCLGAL